MLTKFQNFEVDLRYSWTDWKSCKIYDQDVQDESGVSNQSGRFTNTTAERSKGHFFDNQVSNVQTRVISKVFAHIFFSCLGNTIEPKRVCNVYKGKTR